MNKKSALLYIQSGLCILTALGLIAADLAVYVQGSKEKSADPMANIYSTGAITEKSAFVIPVFVVAVIVTIVCLVLGVKDAGADRPVGAVDIIKNTKENAPSASKTKTVRTVLLVIALILIVAGIINGSLTDVFIKASKICTECIGLG